MDRIEWKRVGGPKHYWTAMVGDVQVDVRAIGEAWGYVLPARRWVKARHVTGRWLFPRDARAAAEGAARAEAVRRAS